MFVPTRSAALRLVLSTSFAIGLAVGVLGTHAGPAQAAGCGDAGVLVFDSPTYKQWWADMPDCPNDCTDAEVQLSGGGGYMSGCTNPQTNRIHWVVDITDCARAVPPVLSMGTVQLFRFNTLLDTQPLVAVGGGGASANGTYSSLYLPTRVIVNVDETVYPNLQIDDVRASFSCPNQ